MISARTCAKESNDTQQLSIISECKAKREWQHVLLAVVGTCSKVQMNDHFNNGAASGKAMRFIMFLIRNI